MKFQHYTGQDQKTQTVQVECDAFTEIRIGKLENKGCKFLSERLPTGTLHLSIQYYSETLCAEYVDQGLTVTGAVYNLVEKAYRELKL